MSRFVAKSLDGYKKLYDESINSPETFWAEFSKNEFSWIRHWDSVFTFDWSKAKFSWFAGAKVNITQNCIDRHLEKNGQKTAILFEPNDPNEKSQHISYQNLFEEVNKTANMLKSMGAKKGDRICLYMPMIPELAFSVLACAKIGAIHSVVFAGFSSKSLSNRINDAKCRFLITSDGGLRGEKITPLKKIADQALELCPSIEKVVVVRRAKNEITMKAGRDFWWDALIENQSKECQVEIMDAEDPLFILYTSGSTGKPKGMVHSSAGYMVYTNFSFRNVFQYKPNQIYWCTADIGWITGHSYIIYGPLSAGATTVMFEGVPNYPNPGRFWEIIDKHKINIFYTAPTAIRSLASHGQNQLKNKRLSTLEVLGTVGEPINEEAWQWYFEHIGKHNCPIVDTWWQTETGGIMISNLANVTPHKATFATLPLPGIQVNLLDKDGRELKETDAEGNLCIKHPWPSMARTIYGDHQRFINTYFSRFPKHYFTGDGAKRDADGNYRITGRVDDIVIVSGHNLGTAEIENIINQHPSVAESAVVGYPHKKKGNAIYAFVQLKTQDQIQNFNAEINALVSKTLGPICKPEKVQTCLALPKTRSGKIMRRILRKIASNDSENLGDVSTLLNPACIDEIKENRIND